MNPWCWRAWRSEKRRSTSRGVRSDVDCNGPLRCTSKPLRRWGCLSVGVAVALMVYLKVMHPPAASNPLVALSMDLSFEFILFPVITGTIVIILLAVFINKIILKRKYPKKTN